MKMKKLIALLALVAMMTVSAAALAVTAYPDDTDYDDLPGTTVHATVGAYDELTGTFRVTLYTDDLFEAEDIEALEAGGKLLAGGRMLTVQEKRTAEDGTCIITCETGEEIYFTKAQGDDDDDDNELTAALTDDDRRLMHAYAVLYLRAADGIVYEDASDPEAETAVVTEGLAEILRIKAEKEETSIGFDFYATEITLNENMEIVKIHQGYDVAQ